MGYGTKTCLLFDQNFDNNDKPALPVPTPYHAFWRTVLQRDEKDTTLNFLDETEVGFETVEISVE